MYRSVAKVVPNEDFTLTVTFDDGEQCTLDMKPYLDFGVFQRIKDYDQFKRVRVAFDTVEWDGGLDSTPNSYTPSARPLPPHNHGLQQTFLGCVENLLDRVPKPQKRRPKAKRRRNYVWCPRHSRSGIRSAPPESQTAEELRMVSPELCGIMEDPLPSACGASPPHCT